MLNYLNPMLCLIYLIGLYIKVKHIYVGIFSDVLYDLVSLTTDISQYYVIIGASGHLALCAAGHNLGIHPQNF